MRERAAEPTREPGLVPGTVERMRFVVAGGGVAGLAAALAVARAGTRPSSSNVTRQELRPATGEGVHHDVVARGIGNPNDAGRARPVARTVGDPDECVWRMVVSVEPSGPESGRTEVYVGDPSDG